MVCELVVDPRGEIKDYRFYPAVMHSHARLTYTAVAAALAANRMRVPHRAACRICRICTGSTRCWRRHASGAAPSTSRRSRRAWSSTTKARSPRSHPVERNDAHRLIEECMLAANVCAADILQEHEHPALYRVHEGPTPEKLADLREFLREFGLQLGGGDEPQAKDYAKLLEAHSRPARLSAAADGAAALAAAGGLQPGERRPLRSGLRGLHALHLADPALSRSARASRHQGGAREQTYAARQLGRAGRALLADRAAGRRGHPRRRGLAEVLLHARPHRREFSATISGVAAFGIFVALDAVYVEGMVHVSELGNDYYHFDRRRATSCWASARAAASGSATGCRCGWCAPISRLPGSTSCWLSMNLERGWHPGRDNQAR